jgi:hypothetical protein
MVGGGKPDEGPIRHLLALFQRRLDHLPLRTTERGARVRSRSFRPGRRSCFVFVEHIQQFVELSVRYSSADSADRRDRNRFRTCAAETARVACFPTTTSHLNL